MLTAIPALLLGGALLLAGPAGPPGAAVLRDGPPAPASSLGRYGAQPPAAPVMARPAGGLTAALQSVLATGAPGAIGLVRHGRRVQQAAAGQARLDPAVPMTPADHFRAGSVTKTFTAVVVLQLAAEHRLGLDDTLDRWLPSVLPYGGQVTVRELLDHTSGIPDYTTALTRLYASQPGSWLWSWTPLQLVGLVAAAPPLFPPGQGWSYSSTNYVLLGMIIQRVTGDSPGAEIQARIIRPLHLAGTSFPADTTALAIPAADGYVPGTGGIPLDVTAWDPSAAGAAGALIATAADLARFYRALLAGRLLPARWLAQMLTTVDAGGFGYGLGIILVRTPCGLAAGHNGLVFGYATDVFTTLDGTRQVVLASNLGTAAGLAAQEAAVAGLLCG
jgi:D-alanyl-D-alanine carboxypeptidase